MLDNAASTLLQERYLVAAFNHLTLFIYFVILCIHLFDVKCPNTIRKDYNKTRGVIPDDVEWMRE